MDNSLRCRDCLLYGPPPKTHATMPAFRRHGWCSYHCCYVRPAENMPDHCRERQGVGEWWPKGDDDG